MARMASPAPAPHHIPVLYHQFSTRPPLDREIHYYQASPISRLPATHLHTPQETSKIHGQAPAMTRSFAPVKNIATGMQEAVFTVPRPSHADRGTSMPARPRHHAAVPRMLLFCLFFSVAMLLVLYMYTLQRRGKLTTAWEFVRHACPRPWKRRTRVVQSHMPSPARCHGSEDKEGRKIEEGTKPFVMGFDGVNEREGGKVGILQRWSGSGGERKREFVDVELGVEMKAMDGARIVVDQLSGAVN